MKAPKILMKNNKSVKKNCAENNFTQKFGVNRNF